MVEEAGQLVSRRVAKSCLDDPERTLGMFMSRDILEVYMRGVVESGDVVAIALFPW